jgi:large subunit ribosomal protein L5
MVNSAMEDSAHLHVAGMIVQAITGARAISCKSKKSVAGFNLREGKYISVKAEITGEAMYHFLSRLVDVVLPKIKDWKGAKGSSGDSSGNITFGLTPEAVGLFPEVEVNYDMFVFPQIR